MTATFSDHALEAMGFRELLEPAAISASFMSVTAYEVDGLKLPEGFAEARASRVAGVDYRVALSTSVNAGGQCLIGDAYVDSEADWLKQVNARGPFVLIAVGPTDFIPCKGGRLQRLADGGLVTYDAFPAVRATLGSWEDRVLPLVVSTVTLAFDEPDCNASLRMLDRGSSGRTPEGVVVHDMRLEFRGEMSSLKSIGAGSAASALDASIHRAPGLNARAAKCFALGTAEKDQMKKFLFFFLALEVQTNAQFTRLDHGDGLRQRLLRNGPEVAPNVASELLARDIGNWRNLADRFVWCATCVWDFLGEADVKLFKELKSARDAIAHGSSSEPPAGFSRHAELLARKVLWASQGGRRKGGGSGS